MGAELFLAVAAQVPGSSPGWHYYEIFTRSAFPGTWSDHQWPKSLSRGHLLFRHLRIGSEYPRIFMVFMVFMAEWLAINNFSFTERI